jgi:hypothetical protein
MDEYRPMTDSASFRFTPKRTLEAAMKLWWFVAAVMLFGAGAGWGMHVLRPAMYEGRASLSTGIDYVRTGPLTDLEEDQAMGLVGDVITATDTLEAAIDRAKEQGITVSIEDLQVNGFSERHNFTWVLRVRHANPEAAAVLTNAWQDAAYSALAEAYGHALMAEELLNYTKSLTSCLENSVAVEPTHAYCTARNLEEIQKELLAANAAKKEEVLASRGLFPAMAFTIAERSTAPSAPVQYGRNSLVLCGALLGFILAVCLVYWQMPRRLFVRDGRD